MLQNWELAPGKRQALDSQRRAENMLRRRCHSGQHAERRGCPPRVTNTDGTWASCDVLGY